MTTVTGKLIGYTSAQRVEMKATLVDVTGKDAVGYVASVPGELVRPVTITPDADGDWTVALTANSLVESDAGDTLWAIQEGRAKDGTPIHTYVVVPATGGPYWAGDIRADLSGTSTGGGTVVYLAGQEGPAGPAGADGADGQDGASAYQVAVANGFVGTESAWLASLVGPQGEPGETGPQGPQPPLGAAGAGETVALKSTDPSTTDARTPTAHKTTHATGGTDALTPADIGAETAGTATTTVTAHTGAADPHGDRTYADTKLAKASNLADLASASTARGNLGLGGAAQLAVGTSAGTVAAGDDARITGALPAAGGTISGNLAVTGNALGQDTPAARGLAAWCYPPAQAVNTTELTNGVLYLVRVNIAANVSVTKLYWWVGNSGSSPVSGQNQVGLYSANGTLLAATTVDAAISSAGLKTTTISSQALTAGSFYSVGMVFNASVPPTLTRASGWTGVDAAANVGLSPATYQYAKNGTGRTALPSSITPASNTGTDFAGPWVAVGA